MICYPSKTINDLYNRQRNVLFETINHIVNGTIILDLLLLLNGNADLTNVQNENIVTAVYYKIQAFYINI
jgi:hypothetical protein